MTTFQAGDIVKYTRWNIDEEGEVLTVDYTTESPSIEVSGLIGWSNASSWELVYRPPTREEVNDLRSRVAELEAALMPLVTYEGYPEPTWAEWSAARKAMGLE